MPQSRPTPRRSPTHSMKATAGVWVRRSSQDTQLVRLEANEHSGLFFSPGGDNRAETSLMVANIDGSGARTVALRRAPRYFRAADSRGQPTVERFLTRRTAGVLCSVRVSFD